MHSPLIDPRYKEVFDIILYYVIPVCKLICVLVGTRLVIDLGWIVDRVRKGSEAYDDRKEDK